MPPTNEHNRIGRAPTSGPEILISLSAYVYPLHRL